MNQREDDMAIEGRVTAEAVRDAALADPERATDALAKIIPLIAIRLLLEPDDVIN